MPGNEKKWDPNAERDLCLAIIIGNQENDRVRHNWPKVHALMNNLGHNFTKDAISQHFTKTIMREFKARHGPIDGIKTNSPGPTPKTKPASRKRGTPITPRRSNKMMVDPEVDDEKELEDLPTPSKKFKKEPSAVKSEDDENRNRERSITVQGTDVDSEFQAWVAGTQ